MSEYNRTWLKVLNVVRENCIVRKCVVRGPVMDVEQIQRRYKNRHGEIIDEEVVRKVLRDNVRDGVVTKHGYRAWSYNRALITGVTDKVVS